MLDTGDAKKKVFKAGSMLIAQGQPASSAYLIQQGRVRVYQEKDGKRSR